MRNVLSWVFTVISIGCFLYIALWAVDGWRQKTDHRQLADSFHQAEAQAAAETGANPEERQSAETVPESGEDMPTPDAFATLLDTNPDTVGWITIEGTDIDYPIVQGTDNEYYLHVDFQGESNKRGAIFLDVRCTEASRTLIVYGHQMKDGTMFHNLARYKDAAYAAMHPDIRLHRLQGTRETYQIAEVLQWDTAKPHEQTFYEAMNEWSEDGGHWLVLVTCDNAAESIRLVIAARRIESE